MRRLLLALVLAAAVPTPGRAQVGIARPAVRPPDTLRHRPAPLGYFFRSLAIPGWGQASLDRKLTGGLFIAFEGLAISMVMKSNAELRYLDQADTATATARRAERQDWITLLVFNHLFSGMEAYVSAHLLDFPRDLHLRVLPGPRPGLGVTIGVPHFGGPN
jgi:hypothetical protein